jgi:hypothetical protein
MASSQQSYQYASFSTSSSTTDNGVQRSGSAYQKISCADPSGARVQTTSQELGGPVVQETRFYDAEGREVVDGGRRIGGAQQAPPQARIESVEDDDEEK